MTSWVNECPSVRLFVLSFFLSLLHVLILSFSFFPGLGGRIHVQRVVSLILFFSYLTDPGHHAIIQGYQATRVVPHLHEKSISGKRC